MVWKTSKLFYEQTWEHFSTEYMLEVTALCCVCVYVHTRADIHVYASPAFVALKDPTTDWSTAVLRGKQGFSLELKRADKHYIWEPSQFSWTDVVFPAGYSAGLLVYAKQPRFRNYNIILWKNSIDVKLFAVVLKFHLNEGPRSWWHASPRNTMQAQAKIQKHSGLWSGLPHCHSANNNAAP